MAKALTIAAIVALSAPALPGGLTPAEDAFSRCIYRSGLTSASEGIRDREVITQRAVADCRTACAALPETEGEEWPT